ncbi:MAG: phosphoenolpyruvate-utilizing protein [Actinobacteria bacterium]|nr:phosphoenolpyruvate-utilizing protein [Actinomycetota bacterium]
MTKIWVVDNDPSQRYPIYTRGNVGEVFPEAVAPLSWTLAGIPRAEPGWRDALVRFGAFDQSEFESDNLNALGVFGGYCYLNVSISRILAVRTPGLTPDLMDQTLFGTSEAPPYDPRPTDESSEHTERIQATLQWVLTTEDLPELLDDQRTVDQLVAARPDLASLTNEELLGHARSRMDPFQHLFAQHLFITYAATVPVGIIQQVSAEIGDPTYPMRLVAGIGGVDSAAPSWALWELARQVAESPSLTAAFDAGVGGILERLREDLEAAKFLQGVDEFVEQFGSRGPNEWEMSAPTWGTSPELALAAVDRMRLADLDARPQHHWDERAADREALTAEIAAKLEGNPEVHGQFLAAVRAAGLFLAGRERTKTTIIKTTHEARLAFHEIARRMVEAGHFEHFNDFAMVRDDEYDDFLVNPGAYKETIGERRELFDRLQQLEPPFIVNGVVPPLDTWRRRGSTPVEVAGPGDSLAGIPGCPGEYTGRARVILSPDDPLALEPGDVLIAPITDPAWTPLFVPAGAVVVDVGAQISHAVIVSRELGIPCVVSVTDGTRRIPDGATVTVNGTAGTVTVH